MGTWGLGTFDDDVACDWLEDLFDSEPRLFFEHCLDLSDQDYLGHVAAVGVVCTAEMLYGLLHGPRAGLPEPALRWLDDHQVLPVDAYLPRAIAGLQRVLGERSEMRLLWEDDSDRYQGWQDQIQSLMHGLSAVNRQH